MIAKFYAVGSFYVHSRNLFVIAGEVIEGSIENGMTVSINLNSQMSIRTIIRTVELAAITFLGQSYTGLVVDYEDTEELDILNEPGVSDEILEISYN